MFWKWSVLIARILAVVWVGTVAVGAALEDHEILPGLAKFESAAWAVSLGVIGIDNLGSLIVNTVRRRRARTKALVERTLMGLLLQLSKGKVLRFEEMSASVFVPTRWSRVQRFLFRHGDGGTRLKRYKQLRPIGHPQQSGVVFESGVGIVGECWRLRKRSYRDLHALAQKWSEVDPSEEGFNNMRDDTRQGFTYRQFLVIGAKYSEVLAEPIWDGERDNKLIGVVSLDRPYAPVADFKPKLNTEDAREQLAAIATVLGRIMCSRSDGE